MTRHEAAQIHRGCLIILALAELTDIQRHAVIGRHWRDRSQVELAHERGVSRAAVAMAERTGLDRLRTLLDRDELEDA